MAGYSQPIKMFHALGQLIRHRLPSQVSVVVKVRESVHPREGDEQLGTLKLFQCFNFPNR